VASEVKRSGVDVRYESGFVVGDVALALNGNDGTIDSDDLSDVQSFNRCASGSFTEAEHRTNAEFACRPDEFVDLLDCRQHHAHRRTASSQFRVLSTA